MLRAEEWHLTLGEVPVSVEVCTLSVSLPVHLTHFCPSHRSSTPVELSYYIIHTLDLFKFPERHDPHFASYL